MKTRNRTPYVLGGTAVVAAAATLFAVFGKSTLRAPQSSAEVTIIPTTDSPLTVRFSANHLASIEMGRTIKGVSRTDAITVTGKDVNGVRYTCNAPTTVSADSVAEYHVFLNQVRLNGFKTNKSNCTVS